MSYLDRFQKYNYPLFGYVRLPNVEITKEERADIGVGVEADNFEVLKAIARKGFKAKVPKGKEQEYKERAVKELDIVYRLGFVDYFLLVWKVTSSADRANIARDFGRGSCAGSLVFYLMGVTDYCDPIKYGLFFERFISEIRAKKKVVDGITYIDGGLAPDVDIDVEHARRGEVIEKLKHLYQGKVCKIATFSTLSGKLLIKECGKVIAEMSDEDMKEVADLIPKEFGIVRDIQETHDGTFDKKGELKTPHVEAFKNWCDQNEEVYEIALKLRDLIKNKGTHPSGYVVAFNPLNEFLPVEYVKRNAEDADSEYDDTFGDEIDSEPCSAFNMEDVAYLTIKLDLLGVRSCSVVADVLRITGEKIENINLDSDPIIYDNLCNLRCAQGIFQIEAPTNFKVNKDVQPKNLAALSDVLAIARPGALSFLGAYVENKCEEIHPLFDPILHRTRGVCLYQEQMMQLAHAIGFTLDEAEILRRVVGKKKIDEVGVWQEKIKLKIIENNLPEHLGDLLWKILEASASYSFNLSHSISYAALSALTAYLKFKYPLQFFTALLRQALNEPKPIEEIQKIEAELRYFGIKLLPPDLLRSKVDFEIEGQNIRYGLSAIKGIKSVAPNILKFAVEGANKLEVFESAKNAKIDIGNVCALIQSGCLESVTRASSRPSLTLQAQLWNMLSDKDKTLALEWAKADEAKYDYNIFKLWPAMKRATKANGKPVVTAKHIETVEAKYLPKKAIYDLNKKNTDLANFFYERMLLGYSYSTKLIDIFREYHEGLMTIQEIMELPDNQKVEFVAVVAAKPFERTSVKNRNKYARYSLSDHTGYIDCMLMNLQGNPKKKIPPRLSLDEVKFKHDGKLPAKETIVYVTGRKAGDTVFLDNMADQCVKIYTKFAQIKKETGQSDKSE